MSIAEFADRNPFVRITVPLMLGIVLCNQIPSHPTIGLIALCVCIVAAVVAYKCTDKYTTRWVPGVFLFASFTLLGYNLLTLSEPAQISGVASKLKCEYRACITNQPSEGERAYKADLRLEAVKVFGEWQNFDAKIVATIEKDSLAQKLRVGQTIIFTSKIDSLGVPKNPFGFDYSQYLQLNGVQGCIFLNSGEWRISSETIRGIKLHALNARQRLIGILEDTGLSGNELGLASTLVLGYKNSIDSEVKQAYMNAGAMHVLAVSGMHVGIVCAVLELLMTILGGNIGFTIKRIIVILLLWAYAFITGLSPSVLRATVMFTFVMIARLANRNMSIYNSLAASAFLLLAYDPTLLFKAGFQLSYAAVVGIVFFQPRIVALLRLNPRNKPLKYIWELTAVSIAAQISSGHRSIFGYQTLLCRLEPR
jgi:competence protein ComEC